MGKKFYAVAVGRNIGIFDTWDDCKKQVHGYPKAKFKSFKNSQDAKDFVKQHQSENKTVSSSSSHSQHDQPQKKQKAKQKNDESDDKKQQPNQQIVKNPYTQSKTDTQNSTRSRIHPRLQNEEDVGEEEEEEEPARKRQKTIATRTAALSSAASEKPITATNNNTTHLQQSQPQHIWFHMNFDGGSRGNPGISGAGAEIVTRFICCCNDNNSTTTTTTFKGGNEIKRTKTKIRNYVGNHHTNNQAEYTGIVVGLEYILQSLLTMTSSSSPLLSKITVVVQGDSELIIKQLKGINKCRNAKLKPFYTKVLKLLESIKQIHTLNGQAANITLEHVYRNKNSNADALANEAMDAKRSWTTTDDINNDGDDWLEDTTTKETKKGKVVHIT